MPLTPKHLADRFMAGKVKSAEELHLPGPLVKKNTQLYQAIVMHVVDLAIIKGSDNQFDSAQLGENFDWYRPCSIAWDSKHEYRVTVPWPFEINFDPFYSVLDVSNVRFHFEPTIFCAAFIDGYIHGFAVSITISPADDLYGKKEPPADDVSGTNSDEARN